MNGIRLAALVVAAISLLCVDLGEAVAQPTQAQIDRMGAGRQGRPGRGSRSSSRTRDSGGDQDRASNNSRTSDRSSNSRRSRSSRSSRSNAIKTNPLFQLFDQDGDGELSLEEIDAASRLLYSLDANEDDAITSDEVKDMVADSGDVDEEDDPPARSSRSRSSSSRSRSDGGQQREQPASGGNPREQQARSGRGSSRGGNAPRTGGRGFGAPQGTGMGGAAAPASGGGGGGDDEFGSYDKDGDGVLKRGEMPRSLRTKFTKMDSNGDKEIDEDEYWDYIDNN